jgi:hypothetical protein
MTQERSTTEQTTISDSGIGAKYEQSTAGSERCDAMSGEGNGNRRRCNKYRKTSSHVAASSQVNGAGGCKTNFHIQYNSKLEPGGQRIVEVDIVNGGWNEE